MRFRLTHPQGVEDSSSGLDERSGDADVPDCMRRRIVLFLALMPAVPVAVASLAENEPHSTRVRVLEALRERLPGAAAIGQSYLKMEPHEADMDRLWVHFYSDVRAVRSDTSLSAVHARIAEDFRLLDTLFVHGVMMARSEARICALIYLEGSSAS